MVDIQGAEGGLYQPSRGVACPWSTVEMSDVAPLENSNPITLLSRREDGNYE
jgi:hypothetical protein